jgi:ABC-type polysaccharide/polyol phosphate transport system ATPase subunit
MTVSIQFDNVSKWFTLYHGESRTFQERVVNIFQPKNRQFIDKEQFWALRNVSFEIEKGQTVGLIGSNGSGKSTALKMIARILEPTSGAVHVNGRVSALLELGAGFHPDLTGRENIFLNGSLMGLSRHDMYRYFDEIIDFSEMEQFIDMPVKHYSSGMYMRLAFSVAIHVKPEILIVDEVLAVGDGNFQRKCMQRIGKLRRSGVTIVLVSHDLDTVARLCHQVIWLNKGAIHEIGPGREIVSRYLAHVNEQQYTQLEESDLDEIGTSVNSTESSGEHSAQYIERVQEAQITHIQIIDTQGKATTAIKTGDLLTIRIHYRATVPIEHPVFGLALFREDHIHVTGPNTQEGSYPIDSIYGEGYIDYIVKEMPLMAGRYSISASIYDEFCTYCYHYANLIHSFIVQPQSTWDQLGVVRFAAEWKLSQPTVPEVLQINAIAVQKTS